MVEEMLHSRDQLYINGDWATPGSTERRQNFDSNTELSLGSYLPATVTDVDRAVDAANRALKGQDGWGNSDVAYRVEVMRNFADAIERRRDELGELIAREVGTPISRSKFSNADTASSLLRFYAGLIEGGSLEDLRPAGRGYSIVRREPVGVVGMIAPWNFPMSTLFFKLAPAMAAGCTAVIKPASMTALNSYVIAEAADEANVPAGVINVVPCERSTGDYFMAHKGIDKLAFTGSTEVGRKVGRVAGENLKPVTLELGGKSAALLLEDANLNRFQSELHDLCFSNNGQACTNISRLIIPDKLYEDAIDLVRDTVGTWKIGNSLDEDTVIGPVVSQGQKESIERYYDISSKEGARTIVGGRSLAGPGYFVEPTVFADVTREMTVFREEIFGPAISLTRYSGDVSEGVELVNDSNYGLSGSVFTEDEDLGLKVSRELETGTVQFNMANFDIGAPFAGRKDSGVGLELGAEAIEPFFHYKTIFSPAIPSGF